MRSFLSLPPDRADLVLVESDGHLLHVYRLRETKPDLPVVLFGHACGFSAGAYLPLFERLAGRVELYAFDARGHGGSDAPTDNLARYTPDGFAGDLARIAAAVAARIRGRPIHYVGHSLGAATLLRLGATRPDLFATIPWRGLLLFEPPIFPTTDIPEHGEAAAKDRDLVARTQRRRPAWPSPEALVQAITGRGLFRNVQPEFLHAYARSCLKPANGDYALACPPEIEAATFASFGNDSTFRRLATFPREVPLHLIAGDPNAAERNWTTAVAPAIAEALALTRRGDPARRFTQLAGRGHLMVQEAPDVVVDLVHDLTQI